MNVFFAPQQSQPSRNVLLATMCVLLALAGPQAVFAQGQGAPVTECDRLAADPDDDQRVAPGVPVWQLLSGEAKKACQATVDTYPNVPRLQYQFGRALDVGASSDNEQAVAWMRKAAEQGYAPAQHYLGTMYSRGVVGGKYGGIVVLPKDGGKATEWFKRAAERGYAPAQYHLGNLYRDGEGVQQDHEKAEAWLSRAAEQGYVLALAKLAIHYGDDEAALPACDGLAADPADDERVAPGVPWSALMSETTSSVVIEACRAAVAKYPGVPRLQYQLGRSLQKALKQEQAGTWLHKAAEQGYAAAQWFIGLRHADGAGVPQNYHTAAVWYRRAAEQENATAQYYLATLFYRGQGVEQSYEQAAAWYKQAAEQGDVRGQNNLGVLYQMGRGVERDYEQAAAWYERAAEQGDADAQTNLGMLYEKGWGVPRDYEKAAALYRQGATYRPGVARFSTGTVNKRAQAHLGYAYYRGRGVGKDLDQAYELLSQAGTGANASPWAMVDALIMEANGIGTRQDVLAAYEGLESLLGPSPYDPSPFNALVADYVAKYLRDNPWLKEQAERQLREIRGGETRRTEGEDGVSIGAVVGGLVLLGMLMYDSDDSDGGSDVSSGQTGGCNDFSVVDPCAPGYWEMGNYFMSGW